MVSSIAALGTNPVLADAVVQGISKASAFQRAATQISLEIGGSRLTELGYADATWVAEGALKPAADVPMTPFDVVGQKLARTALFTEEIQQNLPALTAGIQQQVTNALATTYDRTIEGVVAAPAGFSTFASLTPVELETRKDLIAALAPSNDGFPTSAVVTNMVGLYQLKSLTNSVGAPAFQIVGDDNEGTIEGIPYYVAQDFSAQAFTVVGPFRSTAFWGVVPQSTQVKILTETAEVPDGAGGTKIVALKQHNSIGVLAETRVAFKVANINRFRRIEVAAS